MNIYINNPLSINIINTKLTINLSEQLFKKDLLTKVDKNNFILSLTKGICSIDDYYIQTYDNKNFTIYIKLNLASDGKQILNLDVNAYNIKKENINFKQHVCLNKQSLIFNEESIIKTDQGNILIKNLKSNKNSINNKKIKKIIKSKNYDNDNLILIEKDAFSENTPIINTILKNDQKIFFNNEYIELQNIYFKDKFQDKLSIVKDNDDYFYNIIIDDVDHINLNNIDLELPSYYDISYFEESFYDIKFIQNIIDKKIEEKFFALKQDFLIKNNEKITNNINDFSKKKICEKKEIDNLDNKLIWNHWINYGRNENKKLNLLLKFENADFDRFKKDHPLLSKELNYNNEKIWKNWKHNGKKEKNQMYLKVNYENADFEKFKQEFPGISTKNNNDNKKIWKYLTENHELIKINSKQTFNNSDFIKFKKDYPNLCLRIKKSNDKMNKNKKI